MPENQPPLARGAAASAARGVRPNLPLSSGPSTPGRPTHCPSRHTTADQQHHNLPGRCSPRSGNTADQRLATAPDPDTPGLCPQFSPGRRSSQAPCAHQATIAPPGRTATRKPAFADRNLAPPPCPRADHACAGQTAASSARNWLGQTKPSPTAAPALRNAATGDRRANPSPAASARPTSPRFSMCLALRFARRSTHLTSVCSGHAHGMAGGFTLTISLRPGV